MIDWYTHHTCIVILDTKRLLKHFWQKNLGKLRIWCASSAGRSQPAPPHTWREWVYWWNIKKLSGGGTEWLNWRITGAQTRFAIDSWLQNITEKYMSKTSTLCCLPRSSAKDHFSRCSTSKFLSSSCWFWHKVSARRIVSSNSDNASSKAPAEPQLDSIRTSRKLEVKSKAKIRPDTSLHQKCSCFWIWHFFQDHRTTHDLRRPGALKGGEINCETEDCEMNRTSLESKRKGRWRKGYQRLKLKVHQAI